MSNKFNNIIKGLIELDISELTEFQGNLKDLSEENYMKLKNEILADGFASPIHVWKNSNNNWCIVDGHQRCRALKKMREDGIEIPKLKCIELDAKNQKHAKRLVLALTSQYGNMTKDGLYEFLNNSEIDFSEATASFRFPEIDFGNMYLDKYSDTTPGEELPNVEITGELKDTEDYLILQFDNNEQAKIVREALEIPDNIRITKFSDLKKVIGEIDI